MFNQIAILTENNTNLSQNNHKLSNEVLENTMLLQKLTEENKQEFKNMETTLKSLFKNEIETLKANERAKHESLKSKYESKIKQIEGKLNEIIDEKFKSDKRDASAMAVELTRKASAEIESKYLKRMKE
jgi:hypothetical protein